MVKWMESWIGCARTHEHLEQNFYVKYYLESWWIFWIFRGYFGTLRNRLAGNSSWTWFVCNCPAFFLVKPRCWTNFCGMSTDFIGSFQGLDAFTVARDCVDLPLLAQPLGQNLSRSQFRVRKCGIWDPNPFIKHEESIGKYRKVSIKPLGKYRKVPLNSFNMRKV